MHVKLLRPLLLLLGASLVLAACNGEEVDPELAEGLEGADVTVSSKEFTEQIILGQMLVIALEEAGANVSDETELAGTAVVREALEEGEVDAYWEYTGTAWADIFGEEEVIGDPDELLETVRERDAENGIVWSERGDFENSYAIASSQEVRDEHGVDTLSELADLTAEDPEAAQMCLAEEFVGRDDGWPGLSEHYGIEVPDDQITILDEGVIYSETAESPEDCAFGMVFTTDGRIGALDLHVLEDDEDFFPEYNPAVTMRDDIVEEYPELEDLANEIIATLDTDTMIELNLRADEEGIPHEDVARDHLEEVGLIG